MGQLVDLEQELWKRTRGVDPDLDLLKMAS